MEEMNEDSNLGGLDLYTDLLADDRVKEQESLDELQEKYGEAQEKILNLETQLHQSQQNEKKLQESYEIVQKNMSALMVTARSELQRKTEEITRLRIIVDGRNIKRQERYQKMSEDGILEEVNNYRYSRNYCYKKYADDDIRDEPMRQNGFSHHGDKSEIDKHDNRSPSVRSRRGNTNSPVVYSKRRHESEEELVKSKRNRTDICDNEKYISFKNKSSDRNYEGRKEHSRKTSIDDTSERAPHKSLSTDRAKVLLEKSKQNLRRKSKEFATKSKCDSISKMTKKSVSAQESSIEREKLKSENFAISDRNYNKEGTNNDLNSQYTVKETVNSSSDPKMKTSDVLRTEKSENCDRKTTENKSKVSKENKEKDMNESVKKHKSHSHSNSRKGSISPSSLKRSKYRSKNHEELESPKKKHSSKPSRRSKSTDSSGKDELITSPRKSRKSSSSPRKEEFRTSPRKSRKSSNSPRKEEFRTSPRKSRKSSSSPRKDVFQTSPRKTISPRTERKTSEVKVIDLREKILAARNSVSNIQSHDKDNIKVKKDRESEEINDFICRKENEGSQTKNKSATDERRRDKNERKAPESVKNINNEYFSETELPIIQLSPIKFDKSTLEIHQGKSSRKSSSSSFVKDKCVKDILSESKTKSKCLDIENTMLNSDKLFTENVLQCGKEQIHTGKVDSVGNESDLKNIQGFGRSECYSLKSSPCKRKPHEGEKVDEVCSEIENADLSTDTSSSSSDTTTSNTTTNSNDVSTCSTSSSSTNTSLSSNTVEKDRTRSCIDERDESEKNEISSTLSRKGRKQSKSNSDIFGSLASYTQELTDRNLCGREYEKQKSEKPSDFPLDSDIIRNIQDETGTSDFRMIDTHSPDHVVGYLGINVVTSSERKKKQNNNSEEAMHQSSYSAGKMERQSEKKEESVTGVDLNHEDTINLSMSLNRPVENHENHTLEDKITTAGTDNLTGYSSAINCKVEKRKMSDSSMDRKFEEENVSDSSKIDLNCSGIDIYSSFEKVEGNKSDLVEKEDIWNDCLFKNDEINDEHPNISPVRHKTRKSLFQDEGEKEKENEIDGKEIALNIQGTPVKFPNFGVDSQVCENENVESPKEVKEKSELFHGSETYEIVTDKCENENPRGSNREEDYSNTDFVQQMNIETEVEDTFAKKEIFEDDVIQMDTSVSLSNCDDELNVHLSEIEKMEFLESPCKKTNSDTNSYRLKKDASDKFGSKKKDKYEHDFEHDTEHKTVRSNQKSEQKQIPYRFSRKDKLSKSRSSEREKLRSSSQKMRESSKSSKENIIIDYDKETPERSSRERVKKELRKDSDRKDKGNDRAGRDHKDRGYRDEKGRDRRDEDKRVKERNDDKRIELVRKNKDYESRELRKSQEKRSSECKVSRSSTLQDQRDIRDSKSGEYSDIRDRKSREFRDMGDCRSSECEDSRHRRSKEYRDSQERNTRELRDSRSSEYSVSKDRKSREHRDMRDCRSSECENRQERRSSECRSSQERKSKELRDNRVKESSDKDSRTDEYIDSTERQPREHRGIGDCRSGVHKDDRNSRWKEIRNNPENRYREGKNSQEKKSKKVSGSHNNMLMESVEDVSKVSACRMPEDGKNLDTDSSVCQREEKDKKGAMKPNKVKNRLGIVDDSKRKQEFRNDDEYVKMRENAEKTTEEDNDQSNRFKRSVVSYSDIELSCFSEDGDICKLENTEYSIRNEKDQIGSKSAEGNLNLELRSVVSYLDSESSDLFNKDLTDSDELITFAKLNDDQKNENSVKESESDLKDCSLLGKSHNACQSQRHEVSNSTIEEDLALSSDSENEDEQVQSFTKNVNNVNSGIDAENIPDTSFKKGFICKTESNAVPEESDEKKLADKSQYCSYNDVPDSVLDLFSSSPLSSIEYCSPIKQRLDQFKNINISESFEEAEEDVTLCQKDNNTSAVGNQMEGNKLPLLSGGTKPSIIDSQEKIVSPFKLTKNKDKINSGSQDVKHLPEHSDISKVLESNDGSGKCKIDTKKQLFDSSSSAEIMDISLHAGDWSEQNDSANNTLINVMPENVLDLNTKENEHFGSEEKTRENLEGEKFKLSSNVGSDPDIEMKVSSANQHITDEDMLEEGEITESDEEIGFGIEESLEGKDLSELCDLRNKLLAQSGGTKFEKLDKKGDSKCEPANENPGKRDIVSEIRLGNHKSHSKKKDKQADVKRHETDPLCESRKQADGLSESKKRKRSETGRYDSYKKSRSLVSVKKNSESESPRKSSKDKSRKSASIKKQDLDKRSNKYDDSHLKSSGRISMGDDMWKSKERMRDKTMKYSEELRALSGGESEYVTERFEMREQNCSEQLKYYEKSLENSKGCRTERKEVHKDEKTFDSLRQESRFEKRPSKNRVKGDEKASESPKCKETANYAKIQECGYIRGEETRPKSLSGDKKNDSAKKIHLERKGKSDMEKERSELSTPERINYRTKKNASEDSKLHKSSRKSSGDRERKRESDRKLKKR